MTDRMVNDDEMISGDEEQGLVPQGLKLGLYFCAIALVMAIVLYFQAL